MTNAIDKVMRPEPSFQLGALISVSLVLVTACGTYSSADSGEFTNVESPAIATDTPYDPSNPLRSIIDSDAMRGLDSSLRIVDPEQLAASLTAAGLDSAQVEALRAQDLTLETYVRLIQLEVACLKEQGIEASDPQVVTAEYGVQIPVYGYPSTVPGLSETEIGYRQISCQNRFTGAYQTLYMAKFLPSEEERTRIDIVAANRFLACARSLGVTPPLDEVRNAVELNQFNDWYMTPEADIDCSLDL
ncbi:hypothetical protein E9529_06615 [Blastococcus sp. KM273128]|uniref:hypothetical protein n=1 Tax=Blastococcus sp. KM273128 TaxID=2570314 RepID=UPI001F19FAA7|nr:hypothetical protein [Blastococcus sp. KM273128]MCF6743951.1 hypothetical protein [Blastococcus sp. KM273128]